MSGYVMRTTNLIRNKAVDGLDALQHGDLEDVYQELVSIRDRSDIGGPITVDGRFTSEGISVSVYAPDGSVLDETWFTYDEIEEMKSDGQSHFTFEL